MIQQEKMWFYYQQDLVTQLIDLHNSAWLVHKYEVWDLEVHKQLWINLDTGKTHIIANTLIKEASKWVSHPHLKKACKHIQSTEGHDVN